MRKSAAIRRTAWVLGMLLALPGVPARAATGLAYLKIGAGARSVAVGNAVVSHVEDASATYWNPGAVVLQPGLQAELTHSESFGGVRYEFAALTKSNGTHGVGLAFHGLWTDRMDSYDAAGEFIGEFGYYDLALSGTYGFSFREEVGVGIGLSYLREAVDVKSADGYAASLGAQVREILPRTSLGLSMLHLGPSMKFESEPFDLPTTIQGGVSHRLPLSSLGGALLISVEARKARDEDAQLLFGTEYRYGNLARLQFGYRTGLDTEDVSLGIGVGDGSVRGQYAYVPFGENLGEQHRISIQFRR